MATEPIAWHRSLLYGIEEHIVSMRYHLWRLPRAGDQVQSERGMALVAALLFLVVVGLLSSTTASVTTLYSQISGNYKASIQAFQAAEGGAEEARGRLRGNATSPITDAFPTQTGWRAYIGSLPQAQSYGYTSGTNKVLVNSLQSNVQYTVVIGHALNSSGEILYWGDPNGTGTNTRNNSTGQNIYQITSYGTSADAQSVVQTQVARVPPLPVRGTLYVESQTTVQGSSTNIIGEDRCGTDNRPGITTPLGSTLANGNNTIVKHGGPNISGTPPIQYNSQNLDVQALVDARKDNANFVYTVTSQTHTGNTTPGPGDNWGTPAPGNTQQDPSTCTEYNTVHYQTNNTYVRLSGGVKGCGTLLVEGHLEVHGSFSWYGPIIATGSVIYTGGGNKNVTGAIISGGSVLADVIGGNANLVNCSAALLNQTQNAPLIVLSWGTF